MIHSASSRFIPCFRDVRGSARERVCEQWIFDLFCLTDQLGSWRDQWGWVSSPLFAGDIFAHAEDLTTGPTLPTLGAHVLFTVGQDKKGRVRALNIELGRLPPGASSAPNPGAYKRKLDMISATGDTVAGAGYGAGGAGKGFEAVEGVQLQGVVASWRSPWGWVSCEGFGGDLFAHSEDIDGGGELSVGEPVSFVVGRDVKSRWRARQIFRLGGTADAPDGVDALKYARLTA